MFPLPWILAPLVLAAGVAAQGPPPPLPPLTPLQPPTAPAGNPITAAKTHLGMALFWDEQMSSTKTISCGTCHLPEVGGSDLRSRTGGLNATHPGVDSLFGTPDDIAGSPGVPRSASDGRYVPDGIFGVQPQVTSRKAQSTLDAGYSRFLFWDGRANDVLVDPISGQVVLPFGAALENQVLGPPTNDVEMGHIGRAWSDVVADLVVAQPMALAASVPSGLSGWIVGRSYPQLFLEAFGSTQITPSRVAMAIATYERTLVSDMTPLDQELRGIPTLTQQQRAGMQLFGQVGCASCHSGSRFTDDSFRDIGLRPEAEDVGRFAVTGNLADRGRFKVPSLRNVALRAPFMHNGSFTSLAQVVAFYNRGGDFQNPGKAPQIQPLGLSPGQQAAIVAFLQALTDPRVATATGPFARPTLYSEGSRQPREFGDGTAGTGGFIPRMVALEPPFRGNSSFTVALDRGLAGRMAILATDLVADPSGTGVFGIQSHLGLSPGLQLFPAGPLAGAGAGGGSTSLSFDLNLPVSLVGLPIHAQWLVFDPGSPGGGLAASNAVTAVLF